MLKKAVFVVAALSGAATAETLTCPVGGERFEAPVAPECSDISGQTMLLMSLRCPPDPMPQCPQNFLPMYRAFSAEELPLLTQYMQTESYESLVDFSPFYLAYNIEKYLNGPDAGLPAWILLRGLWHDPAQLGAEPGYLPALTLEFEAQLTDYSPNENTIVLAQLAFLNLLDGDAGRGRAYLARAENQRARGSTVLKYLNAVRLCFVEPSLPHCNATAAIPEP